MGNLLRKNISFFQCVTATCALPAEGAALVCFAPSQPNANQITTGNKSGALLLTIARFTILARAQQQRAVYLYDGALIGSRRRLSRSSDFTWYAMGRADPGRQILRRA
jgi:hypothetical protein